MKKTEKQQPHVSRSNWLRAAVLGADDGIISTASLIVGVAAASTAATGNTEVLIAATAGLFAGSLSMAAGEYVSVSSLSDAEDAELKKEKEKLLKHPQMEHKELARIYIKRGVSPDVADLVAAQLMEKDALGAHARDEFGISDMTAPRPIQAALASALSFAGGAFLPLLVVLFIPYNLLVPIVSLVSLASLGILGALGAWVGGANMIVAALRVTFWGALAMAVTSGIGMLIGHAV
jgi:VIT1/CCC1 family predicted Fe2+/Mn2+ transporter